MKDLLSLFLTFMRVGGLTFGGGYAMMPLLQKEVVEKKKWATMDEIMDWYAIGQCLPGLIMVNTSLFVGNKQKGVAGGIAAAVGSVFPSFIIITVIAALLENFADQPAVIHAFAGIRVCVTVLVINAVVTLWKKAIIDKLTMVVFLAVCALSYFTDISPIVLVVGSAVLGIAAKALEVKKNAA